MHRVAVVLVLVLPVTVFAGDVSWVGLDNGNWNVPDNWSGGMVPDPSDSVTILGANVTVNDERIVNGSFTLGEDASINVSTEDGSLTVNGPANIDNGRIQASAGGVLNLPTVTEWSYDLCIMARALISVQGASVIDLPALTSISINAPSCGTNFFVSVLATTGGTVNTPELQSITTAAGQTLNISLLLGSSMNFDALETMGRIGLLVDGMSAIAFPALTSITGGTVSVNIDGSISAPELLTAEGVFFSPGGPGTLNLPKLETATDCTFAVPNDSSLLLPALESTMDTNISLSPGSIFDAPELTTVESTTGTNIILSVGDVTLSVPKLDSMRNMIASSADGAMLDLSSLRTFTWDVCHASAIFTVGGAGSIDVSGLETMTINLPNCPLQGFPSTAIQGSMLDFSNLRTISITGNHSVSFFASDAGTVVDVSQLRTFPIAQVLFLEQNGGVILRFTGGGGGGGNGDPACGEEAMAATRGAASRGNFLVVALTLGILAMIPRLRRGTHFGTA